MTIEINYLRVYQKQIEDLTSEFSRLREAATVTAPKEDVKQFVNALQQLKSVILSINRPA